MARRFPSSPYHQAADLVNQVIEKGASLKTLIYDRKGQLRCSLADYAIASSVVEHLAALHAILQHVDIAGKNQGLLMVLIYELLIGKHQSIKGGGALKRQIMAQEAALREAWARIQPTEAAACSETLPRYVRVNTLRATTQDVVDRLHQLEIEVYRDPHVDDLLVVDSSSSKHLLADQQLSSSIILQDKSSCFSALALVDGRTGYRHVLDACAAPGNKTTHLAALLLAHHDDEPAKVTALDRDNQRFRLLQQRIAELVPGDAPVTVQAKHQDFLATKPMDFADLDAILLDPSCSGSGILGRGGQQLDSQERLAALAGFQTTALRHALTFAVDRVVYSTCSVHEPENEGVVSDVLKQARDEWHLVAPACLESWPRRGRAVAGLSADEAKCLIRVEPGDETNGFFVAVLERKTVRSRPKQRRRSVVDLPVYAGQFRVAKSAQNASKKRKQAIEKDNDTTATKEGKTTEPSKERKKAKKKPKRSTTVEKEPTKKSTQTVNPSSAAKTSSKDGVERSKEQSSHKPPVNVQELPNKIRKKLAWKQRQRQEKLERMKRQI